MESNVTGVYDSNAKMLKQMEKLNEIHEIEGEVVTSKTPQNSSVLFEGYRALGHYASAIPFSVVKSDQDTLIASSVG